MEVQRIYCFWRICWYGYVYESKKSDCKETVWTQCTDNPADNSKRTQDWLQKNLMEVWEKEIGLPAPLNAALWAILHGASLNWGSEQSFTTKPMPWSWRSWRWWGPSPGTPWRRPAGGSGPVSRLSSLLTAVLSSELILNMFLFQPVFNSVKSDGFQLWCVILK